jgi:putative inorganic carbon (HCO3(-)) transporter
LDKAKIISRCDKIILFCLYGIAYFLPISKGIIETLSIFAIIFFIIKKAIQRRGIPSTYINFGIFAYASICFFSILFSSNLRISSITFFCKTLQNFLFFFTVVDVLNSERRIKPFLYILFASSLLLGIDGIYQHFTHKDFIRHRPIVFVNRIYTTFPTPNDFGCYLVTVIPFLIVTFFAKLRTKIFKFAIVGLFLLLFTCLILSVSRGAWLGFVASILFLGFWLRSVALFFLLLGTFLFAFKQIFPPLIRTRMSNLFNLFDMDILTDGGSIERKIFWHTGWRMFLSSPLIGVGIGTFMFNYKKFLAEDYLYGPFYAHNCYLQIAAETGIVGLFAFLLILILFFFFGIKTLNNRNNPKTFSWYILLGSLAAILAYCVHMAVDTSLYSLDLGMLFWLVLGLGAAVIRGINTNLAAR